MMLKRLLASSFISFSILFFSLTVFSLSSVAKESADYLTELDSLLRKLEAEGALPQRPSSSNWKTRLAPVIRDLSLPPIARFSVIGPTKVGKSTILNAIAQIKVSSTHTRAGHTKQSVAIVPKEAGDASLMARMFPGLNVFKGPAKGAEAEKSSGHNLFYEVNPRLTGRIIIDAADLNSHQDHRQRALEIAHVSDVVLFVINQTSYGTLDIQSAFSEILGKDRDRQKPVIVLINGAILPRDDRHWPEWLKDFQEKTGVNPLASFVVPMDTISEDEPKIEFFKVLADGKTREKNTTDLGTYLNSLNTTELRLQAHQSTVLQALFEAGGAQEVIDELKSRIEKSRELSEIVDEYSRVTKNNWPVLPVRTRFKQISEWWDHNHRLPLTRYLSGLNNYLKIPGRILVKMPEFIRGVSQKDAQKDLQQDPMVIYKEKEREAIVGIAMAIMEKMGTMVAQHSELFSDQVKSLFQPSAYSALNSTLLPAYEEDKEKRKETFEKLFNDLLDAFEEENPGTIKAMLASDTIVNGLIAPMTTVACTVSGYWGAVGAETLFSTAFKMLSQPVNSAVAAGIGGSVAATTEDAIQHFAGENAIVNLFNSISDRYRVTQAAWVVKWLAENHLGPLYEELGFAQKWESRTELDSVQTCVTMLKDWAHGTQN